MCAKSASRTHFDTRKYPESSEIDLCGMHHVQIFCDASALQIGPAGGHNPLPLSRRDHVSGDDGAPEAREKGVAARTRGEPALPFELVQRVVERVARKPRPATDL